MDYVVIGNSAAAIGCVEGIRKVDKKGSITIISNEPHHAYSRPLISYLLYGKTDEQRMKYRPDSFYEDNGCKFMAGRTVAAIDAQNKNVTLENGEKINYDKLMYATGSRPFIPPAEGLDTVKNKFTFMSLDDAKALKAALTKESRVLIMGAGLIGLKCAEGISNLVKKITVADLATRILPSVLDDKAAAIVQKHIEKQNVSFILGDSVKSYDKNTATLSSGKTVEFDVLVIAVGVRPNTALLSEAGGDVNRGVKINSKCETSLPDIYAAGDCVESYDVSIDSERILAILPNAYMQGECAGINMAGGSKEFTKSIPMNSGGFFGLHIITAGDYNGENYVAEKDGDYKRLVTKDGVLKGMILVGDIARAGIYANLIKNQTPLDTLDFELIKEKPQLMAFSATERAKMLGGA